MMFEVGPFGCLPALRAMSQSDVCVDGATQLSMAHNGGVALVLDNLQAALPDFTILRGHFFSFFMERLDNPTAHGTLICITSYEHCMPRTCAEIGLAFPSVFLGLLFDSHDRLGP